MAEARLYYIVLYSSLGFLKHYRVIIISHDIELNWIGSDEIHASSVFAMKAKIGCVLDSALLRWGGRKDDVDTKNLSSRKHKLIQFRFLNKRRTDFHRSIGVSAPLLAIYSLSLELCITLRCITSHRIAELY